MQKAYKEFINEGQFGADTFDRTIKRLVKKMDTELKSRKIEFKYDEGYNSAWFRFLGHDVYVQGLSGGREYQVYKGGRTMAFGATAKQVIDYIESV